MFAVLLKIFESVVGVITVEQRLFLMRAAWVTFVSAHILWVCGWLAILGPVMSSPFAHADTLDQLTKIVTEDRIDRLQREILSTRVLQCQAIAGTKTRDLYTDLLQELWDKYKSMRPLTDPRVPSCGEL